jgi:hypothetical protein
VNLEHRIERLEAGAGAPPGPLAGVGDGELIERARTGLRTLAADAVAELRMGVPPDPEDLDAIRRGLDLLPDLRATLTPEERETLTLEVTP